MAENHLLKMTISLSDDVKTAIADAVRQAIEETRQNTTPNTGSDLITREAALKLLEVTAPTLHDWTRRGLIPSYRIGARVYYKRSEIETALSRRDFGRKG